MSKNASLSDAAAISCADRGASASVRSARSALGLSAVLEAHDSGWALRLRSERCAQSVHVEDEGFRAEDEWFHLAPGIERVVPLIAREASSGAVPDGEVHALNGLSPVRFRRS